MSGKNLRYVQQSFRARIEHDLVLTRMGEMTVRDIDALTRALLYQLTGKTAAIMEGLDASPVGNLDVELTAPATAILNLGDQNVRFAIDHNGGAPFSVTMDAADPVDPRIDIIEATIKTRSAFSDSVVDVVDPVTKTVTPQLRDRDFEVYLEVRKKTGTPAGPAPSPTAGTAGVLTGTIAIPGTIDLSAEYIINLAVGNDSEYVEVDCRGATPAATTAAEILTALNGAGFGVIAAQIAGDFIELTAPGTGENSVIRVKQPTDPSTDALNNIFGLSESVGYFVQYAGTNPYFKVAEINVAATQTVLNPTDVKPRADKDTDWTADAASILNGFSLQAHRESAPMDHAASSVEGYHLAPSALAVVTGRTSRIAGATDTSGSTTSQFYALQRTFALSTVINTQAKARMQTLVPTKFTGGDHLPLINITTAGGTPLAYNQIESQYPLSRVDQRSEDTVGNYSVQTSLIEAPSDIIPFTPTVGLLFSSRFKRFGVFLKTRGSGYTDLVFDFHDSGNNLLFSRSIPYASLNDAGGAGAWNYVSHGLLDNIYTLTPGSTYHVHCYVIGFTVGTTPVLGRSAGGVIAFRAMYRPEAGVGVLTNPDRPFIQTIDGSNNLIPLIAENGVNDDDTQPFAGESKVEIMAADFSDTAYWESFTYQNYIAIDPATGRIKLKFNINYMQLFWSFNTVRAIADTDALTIKLATPDSSTSPLRETPTLQQVFERMKHYLETGWPMKEAVEFYEFSEGARGGRRRLQKIRFPFFIKDTLDSLSQNQYIEARMTYDNSVVDTAGQYSFRERGLKFIDIYELVDGALPALMGLTLPVDGVKIGRITINKYSQNTGSW